MAILYFTKKYEDLENIVGDHSHILKEPIYYFGSLRTHKCLTLAKSPWWTRLVERTSQINYYYQAPRNIKFPLAWSAPECLETLKWDKKSDVWSWGVLMW